jgi:Uncharacterized Fe-S protein
MTNAEVAQRIKREAHDLGYAGCGILPLERLDGYGEKLRERIQNVPESEKFYARQEHFIDPRKKFPWAESVVIVAKRYGIYNIPKELKGHIGKTYLFDARIYERAESFQKGLKMESLMRSIGLKFEIDRKFDLVGLRWAAMQAGIGLIRRNNFLYTRYGSWVELQAWLTDKKMESTETANLPQCPADCNRCIKVCPTGSLSAPYTMSPTKCVSFLTTFGGRDLPNEPLRYKFGNCIYGCDICQDVCPMNKGKWEEQTDFPGLAELSSFLTPERIMEMDETVYKQFVQPKFFYLKPDELWKWKVNALCFMRNHYQKRYKSYITSACNDTNEKIRELAQNIRMEQGDA